MHTMYISNPPTQSPIRLATTQLLLQHQNNISPSVCITPGPVKLVNIDSQDMTSVFSSARGLPEIILENNLRIFRWGKDIRKTSVQFKITKADSYYPFRN